MLFSSPVELSDNDKLNVLRRLDRFRRWNSLDEERICRRCDKHLTGRDIIVIGGSRGCGPLPHNLPDADLQFDSDGLATADSG